jgi:V/A-type H+-transporting ATPase subunit I
MFRPERMSRVSVTGTTRVMTDVIEAVHDLNRVHLTEYDGSWAGFDPGDPIDGAEEISEKLVTIRSLENVLDLGPEDAGPTDVPPEDELEERLETVRTKVNELDDRRSELREELRGIEERIDAVEPFADLGIDLDLLRGYDSLSVAVGEAEAAPVEAVATDLDAPVETFAGNEVVAVFTGAEKTELEDALVGVEFRSIDVPEGEGSPGEFVDELEHERERIKQKLERVETDIEELKLDAGGFLLAAEERLSIEVQKAEAPLTFATTENAFIAEGWVPTSEYDDLVASLENAVGDAIEVEELERAEYDDGHAEEQEVVADGGTALGSTDPPVVQDNPGFAQPFEAFVGAVGVPNYDELDPTVILFLTFPLFFGFMIGDIGYGLVYVGIGYWMMQNFESDGLRSMGGVGMWCGGFTVLFGVLYGEFFGLHFVSDLIGGAPIHKGLQPKYLDKNWSLMWLSFAVFAGIAHLLIAWSYDFVNNLRGHGAKEAVFESASWILMALGFWSWVFSGHLMGTKPNFLFNTPFWGSNGELVALLPVEVGFVGLGAFFVGGAMVTYAEGGVGFLEAFISVSAFGTILSYTRITAVLVAKAGMALGVNLLVFGATLEKGEYHFIALESGVHGEEVFPGLLNGGIGMAVLGIVVLVLGHMIVLALGVTSAGLQAVRLEYVEFFGEFYEGSGEEYDPFGYERSFTSD